MAETSLSARLATFGVKLPLSLARDPDETGVVKDASGREVFTVDVHSNRWNDRDGFAVRAADLAEAANASAVDRDVLDRDVLDALKAMLEMIEASVDGAHLPDRNRPFRRGYDDMEIKPDGSMKLSDIRNLIARAGRLHSTAEGREPDRASGDVARPAGAAGGEADEQPREAKQ